MAGGKRPERAGLNQRKGLAHTVFMDASGAGDINIVSDDNRPVAQWHIVEALERIDGCLDSPDRAEIAGYLLLQGGAYDRQLAKADVLVIGVIADECNMIHHGRYLK